MDSNANPESKEGVSLGSNECYLRIKNLYLSDPIFDHNDMLPVH